MFDLEKIESPDFVKELSTKELNILSSEIRDFLVQKISKTGGHLASNLGAVELTIALHYVFDAKKDKFIFDVGHQAYTHKILTGRASQFDTLRQFGGLSGYTSPRESKYDLWESAHSSNSISAMTGIIFSNDVNSDERVISIIGDSSIANGMAFEAMNFLGNFQAKNPIIILNDNKMGISKSVGSLSKILNRLRGTKIWRGFKKILNFVFPTFITNWFHQVKRGIKGFVQIDNIFEDLGFDYFGPIDGNDIKTVIKTMQRAKQMNTPCVIHLLTKKGLGYPMAEQDNVGNFHGVSPFDVQTGKPLHPCSDKCHSYSHIVSETLIKLREKRKFYVVVPAMMVGSKLEKFAKLFPESIFDVGIAEEHAASMAAGFAVNKKDVVLLMYSTFAQRAYDQIINDICRQNLKVIIGIDRAGIVGEDGSTHQGIYDVAMFNHMPNLKIAMPRNASETYALFSYALQQESPIVIRYPKNVASALEDIDNIKPITGMDWEIIQDGKKAIVISYGPDLDRILSICETNKLDVVVVNARFIKPIDEKMVRNLFERELPIIVYEQVVTVGALSSSILNFALNQELNIVKFKTIGLHTDEYVTHGKIETVLNHYALGDNDILKKIKEVYEN